MPYALNQDLRIHYIVEGSGPYLLLQHGFTWTSEAWRACGYIEALRDRFTVIAVDARGHGKSDKPHDPARYQISLQASDVIAVLDDLGLGTVAYWGYSMGGRIGYALACDHPDRLSRLIIGGAHPFARPLPDRPVATAPEAFIRALYNRTGGALERLPAAMERILFENDFAALSAATQAWPPLEAVMARMRIPTLLYVGGDDPYLEKVRICAAEIKTADPLLVLDGLDHSTAFWDSAAVLQALDPHLD